jgi:hypothetical protein
MVILRAISSSSQSVTVLPSAGLAQPRSHARGKQAGGDQLGLAGVTVAGNANVADRLCGIGFHLIASGISGSKQQNRAVGKTCP